MIAEGRLGMARVAKTAQKAVRKQAHPIDGRPQEDKIRLRAYELYLARGATSGHELDDWLRAEQELQQGV